MPSKSCFLIGHSETPDAIYPALVEAVERHIREYNVTEFVVGKYGNFDSLAAQAVINAKTRHPEITLLLLLPYHPAERPISTPTGFDSTYYPPGMKKVPRRLAIIRANRYMVEHSDYLIAYVRHNASGASEILSYAEKQAKKRALGIENLAPQPQGLHQQ